MTSPSPELAQLTGQVSFRDGRAAVYPCTVGMARGRAGGLCLLTVSLSLGLFFLHMWAFSRLATVLTYASPAPVLWLFDQHTHSVTLTMQYVLLPVIFASHSSDSLILHVFSLALADCLHIAYVISTASTAGYNHSGLHV